MKRFLMTAMVAALGLSVLNVTSTWAAGQTREGTGKTTTGPSHFGATSGHRGEFSHSFRASERFNYGRYGFKGLSWSHYCWSSYYRCYFYWAPSYGWCFYEPSHACYLPFSYYREVYPETAPVVTTTPSVVQQTTVVTVPPAPAVDLPSPPPPPPAPVAPAPVAVQKTKVGAGVP
jgi:hypothetical protein